MNRADLEQLHKILKVTQDWHLNYPDEDTVDGYTDSQLANDHSDGLRLIEYALADLQRSATPQPAPQETVERCQRVPEHCNKIMWKGHYIRLRYAPALRPNLLLPCDVTLGGYCTIPMGEMAHKLTSALTKMWHDEVVGKEIMK